MSTATLERPTTVPKEVTQSPALARIQSEYREMPGLILTEAQVARLLDIDPQTCRTALGTLVERRFLRRTTHGAYVRASF
jgi:DNA-binding IclR family transcriptional regulator